MTPQAFLLRAGFGAARVEPLPGDASTRRYARLVGGPEPALLMDSPPGEGLDAFLALAAHLSAQGLRPPRILAAEPAHGLALIEDLGETTMADALDAGADPLPLYLAAAETLAALHEAALPQGLPDWTAPRMTEMAGATFLDWWWQAALGRAPAPAERADFAAALHAMLAPFAGRCFTHRDYFPANLMPVAGGMALLDFQDAALGHPAYDLVSLVEDGRRDVAEDVRQAAIARYLERRPSLDGEAFRAAMAAMAAQRHLRVAALWTRLALRDGKPRYLVHGPRCWALLDRALTHPATRPLARFLDAHVPRALRRNPEGLAACA